MLNCDVINLQFQYGRLVVCRVFIRGPWKVLFVYNQRVIAVQTLRYCTKRELAIRIEQFARRSDGIERAEEKNNRKCPK